ncbi:nucleotide sugar epimerase [Saccharobesus litoralis]|uniref:Nucleotide sugar epimerase n=1 Tax=Saccharobesus litoralis TaxID=2172099 RepID=A0A2S0VU86_9ALTE|nr:NAD-dependent epimerase/dehydratase family protein [Saccharobesus litoralis]AWB67778.1 nucleotide sugar epimerase [Saccharobesus litoralis]
MNILITGGLGQIGSHIAELLLKRGDKVLVIDNLATGRKEHLDASIENLEIVIESIANKEIVEELFSRFKPDVVVHTAASYKDPNDWYNDTLTNCVGGSNVIAAAKKQGARFIYFQTALCYGLKPNEQPITLNHPKNPAGSSYAITKTANEDFLELSGIDYVTFRLANVIGPRNVAGPLPIFYQRLKSGKQCFVTEARRDFVFVKDLAEITVKACDGMGSGTYHFSSGSDVAIKELYDYVVDAMGFEEYPEPDVKALADDDVFSILLDPSRTFKDFGQIEFTPLSDTVKEGIEYYKQHGTLGEYTHLKMEKAQ